MVVRLASRAHGGSLVLRSVARPFKNAIISLLNDFDCNTLVNVSRSTNEDLRSKLEALHGRIAKQGEES
jgi:hypothetical protein